MQRFCGQWPREKIALGPIAVSFDQRPQLARCLNTLRRDINAERSIHVLGKVQGTITANEDIWIAEGADVNATVTAQRVIVGGTLTGAAIASSRFEVLPSGQVAADVTSPISVVHEGATINGNFRVGGDGEPETRPSAASVVQRRSRTTS